jgi:PhzF family phenazine biosynthesis protein
MTAPKLRAVLVEAFAAQPFQGNGAAVVLLEQPMPDPWLQGLATSFQQSETAFLLPQASGGWALRWFTPSCEVPLCGHATLAATLALGHWDLLAPGMALNLASRSGPLAVSLLADQAGTASLVLPGGGLQPAPCPDYLPGLVGSQPLQFWGSALGYRVALLDPTVDLADLRIDPGSLQHQERPGLVLMQACSRGGADRPQVLGRSADYQLRFFAPGLGIPEDPVTGSAHALVAPWWLETLGQSQVVGWQASARRGGMLSESPAAGLVRLTGSGHLLWDGLVDAGGMPLARGDWSVCKGY